ncbi:hypothetical protein GLOTRDRAFT_126289 [Gloeophyllum trabeum ATCC 11539]|uniref:Uncharacterized protein n=1 Tax=Gloeophyllum trabeum (strain ATCC 11539 / FP-39264 / Madison 617) TaxID=670483 RepID=S7RWR6_GLOTA|nr:uncharacterized protein GLOTRDRAFT_126289 [Gloeophyllum trabeum ATCC 11539]EPQ57799.1 hypothetical protein GLOTRDRAFT_126289 [Gloeophyllum trabeum ATCC 11539]
MLKNLLDSAELELGYETEEEEVDKEEVDDSEIDWDSFSATSIETKAEDNRIEVIPDFVMARLIVAQLKPTETEDNTQSHAGPPEVDSKREIATQQEADPDLEAKTPHLAGAHILYDGRLLMQRTIFLMEEDKRGPSRKNYHPSHRQELAHECDNYLRQAEKKLLLYMFIYFYLVDDHAVSMVCRSVSGAFWHWTEFHRSKIPLHSFPTTNAALSVASILSEKKKYQNFCAKWDDQPVFEVGTKESDAALTGMMKIVFTNIKKYSPRKREGATLLY